MVGWVYAFVTPSMPGIIKFGATDRDPIERLRKANACTWHLHVYTVAAATRVDDPFAVERLIHALLATRRVRPRREFFRATADEARALLALIVPPDVSGEQVSDAPSTLEVPVAESAEELDDDQRGETGDTGETGETEQRHTSHRDQSGQRPGDSAQDRLRAWVESKYTYITMLERDAGTKLDKLYGEYTRAGVHARPLGKITFARMLCAVYPGPPRLGPHRDTTRDVSGLYLLR